jgi:hypothetical protein
MPRSVRIYLSTSIEEGARNHELLHASCQMRDEGFSLDETLRILTGKAIADGLSEEESVKTIESAFSRLAREAPQKPSEASRKAAAPVHQPAAVKLPEPIPDGLAALLKMAFWPDEYVAIGPGEFKDGRVQCPPGTTYLVSRLLERLAKEPIDQIYPYSLHPDGLYLRINPMVKGGMSDKDVTSYRHLLVEFDHGEKQVQYAALLESGLPLSAIIDSGGASIHGWVRVKASDLKDYKRRAELVYRHMGKYGVDPSNRNPSRYSRIPGITRICRKET